MKILDIINGRTFYSQNVANVNEEKNLVLADESEFLKPNLMLHDVNIENNLNDEMRKIYYISDIHINHKLLQKFPHYTSRKKIEHYIEEMVNKIVETVDTRTLNDYLIIGGDTSFNFEISKIFYENLKRNWGENIIVILGNHELWDFSKSGKNTGQSSNLEYVINKYKELFKSLNIYFLHNDVLVLKALDIYDGYKPTIISEQELINISDEELKKILLKSRLSILGGLGFSGFNKEFNASSGLYRTTISNIDEDVKQTNRFNYIYQKIKNIVPNSKLIVATHTPKTDWSTDDYNPNWIYVNGHTHKNYYSCMTSSTVYADNQVGYYSSTMGLKFFRVSTKYDIFKEYNDGIYNISRDEYIEFNLGQKIRVNFNRTNGNIKMLKRQNLYFFLYEKLDNGKIYLLNGGIINKLEKNDVQYYFDKMLDYSNIIKQTFNKYNNYLRDISKSI